jgi:hypothetical protein
MENAAQGMDPSGVLRLDPCDRATETIIRERTNHK